MKTALIFGAGGQAGYYLLRLLNSKGYDVTALRRNDCDVSIPYQVTILNKFKPDEVYNLAAKMFAPASWDSPVDYMQTNAVAVAEMLDCYHHIRPDGKFFQAGSAEIFDQVYPLNEESPIRPRNPYGVSKATAQELVRVYREQKGMFACTGILFNMESPRRPETFFSVKVAKAVARIMAGEQEKLVLGQLHAQRDWGLTEEYVEAMWMMLQAKEPKDYVIGTGEVHSCLDFVRETFLAAGWVIGPIPLEWDRADPMTEDILVSDPRKIRDELGWYAKTRFSGLVRYLVSEEMKKLGQRIIA